MRKAFGFTCLALLAACSQGPQNRGDRSGQADTSASDTAERSAAPGITPTAAPGVAFNYRYAFRLPAERIAGVQEEHAAACEKLGLDRCRITGMSFRRNRDNDIEGRLDLKLDPAIARAFGKQATEAVTHSDGLVAEQLITGEDAGSAIVAANRGEAQQGDDLRKIEAQLARPGLRSAERAELQAQAQQIRDAIRASQATKSEKQESLARTPMTFAYESGEMAPGFRRSLSNGLANLVGGAQVLLTLAITLLPWILLGILIWWAIRRFRPKPVPQEA